MACIVLLRNAGASKMTAPQGGSDALRLPCGTGSSHFQGGGSLRGAGCARATHGGAEGGTRPRRLMAALARRCPADGSLAVPAGGDVHGSLAWCCVAVRPEGAILAFRPVAGCSGPLAPAALLASLRAFTVPTDYDRNNHLDIKKDLFLVAQWSARCGSPCPSNSWRSVNKP